MNKPTITIKEVLSHPHPEDQVRPFDIGDNIPVALYGNHAMTVLAEFAKLAQDILMKEPLVVFWGLSGNLANFYSKVPEAELQGVLAPMDAINTKIGFLKPTQPFTVARYKSFEITAKKLGGINTLHEIPFDEALLVVEGKKAPPQMQYEEPEDDEVEFDENCLPTCMPGRHVCGK